ncbi:MAG: hypothetical protein HYY04_17735 [Chloroflexi bacterium]|nr:hypothetical protein [Chloroflexota bacterium]
MTIGLGTVIGLAIVGVLLALVLAPVIRRPRLEENEAAPVDLGQAGLEAQRDQLYADLRDLDFDHRLGKLSGTDYHDLRRHLERRAALVLLALDEVGGALDQTIEDRIAHRRHERASTGARTIGTADERR